MTNGKCLFKLRVIAAILLCFVFSVAENAHAKNQAIKFQTGSTSATVKGSVLRGERAIYLVGAKASQTMVVEISSTEKNAVFQLRIPGKGEHYLPGAGEEDDATSWRGALPQAGTYKIIVGGTRGNAEYSLRVEIKD
ncbi:MAG: hypothetical protein HY795_10060 [Desulfovibrio sp.]|nr:hypothetical protein [Desulfovibrio sp.]MBI4959646.1 hypothetical protein [Desulfovibrio sp.]